MPYKIPVTAARTIDDINAEIADYEQRHSMTSEQMLEGLRSETLQQTHDICGWQMRLKLRDRWLSSLPNP